MARRKNVLAVTKEETKAGKGKKIRVRGTE